MRLEALVAGLSNAHIIGDGTVEISAVRADSREVRPGDLFVAVKGLTVDGHAYVADAISRGAAAVVVESELPVAVPQVLVPRASHALGELVAEIMGHPARRLVLIGITGTNGKTTSTYLVESMLRAAGHVPGVIGTVSYRWPGHEIPAPYTTPTPQTLHETFASMAAAGCTHVVMEVSSAALEMDRLRGVSFAVAAFSNLTQDHLDVHGTMAAYRDAKRRLFRDHLAGDGVAVVNLDDAEGAGMAEAAGVRRTVGVTAVEPAVSNAVVRVTQRSSSVDGLRATIATPRGDVAVVSRPLIGDYNIANLALAVGIGEALGLEPAAIGRGLSELRGVPGRVERVENRAGLDLFVDYAHTPDALRNVLAALRPLTQRRLICVFGCGGDRDPTKRPMMGAAVAELADLAIVTSDNPRTEEPRAIIDAILVGVPKPFAVEVDRRAAIRLAVCEATPGDVVLIAGKGHEDYQIVGKTKHHFDDREEAARAIADRPSWSVEEVAAIVAGVARGTATSSRIVIDGRRAAAGDLYVAIRGLHHDGHDFAGQALAAGASAVMVEPGRVAGAAAAIEVDDPRRALGDLARAHRRAWRDADNRLVALTGSAGKTTTKELIRAALSAAAPTLASEGSLNNETGVPLSLLGLRPYHRYAVVEMGMRGAGQIEYLTRIAEPDVAVVINAGVAHLELLGSTDAIAAAKGEIWMGLFAAANPVAVLPLDDLRLRDWVKAHAPKARRITFGQIDGSDVRLASYRPGLAPPTTAPPSTADLRPTMGSDLVLEVFGARAELRLPFIGRHNAIDACCALAAALGAGAGLDAALAGLARARPPAMRSEIEIIQDRHVIVDCYNANPASMAAALRMLAEVGQGHRMMAVIGDMLELGDQAESAHREVGELAAELAVPVVALGEFRATIAAGRGDATPTTDDPDEAAARALAATGPGDWILVKASRGMRLERVVAAMRTASASHSPAGVRTGGG